VKSPSPNTFLIGLDLPPNKSKGNFIIQESMAELAELAKTAQLNVIGQFIQKRQSADTSTYIGEGKAQELLDLIQAQEITLLITDDELTPNQQKNLESLLEIKVLDRTGLILEIFAKRAHTYEAQLQVELAQLEYTLPRLTRMWTHLSRQAGGIGTKGPGETQLEVDKRQIGTRISIIKKKIEKVKLNREITRKHRHDIPMITGTLIGYTNAGKSTLLNQLAGSSVTAEDKLFATLDPTTRKLNLPNNDTLLLTDTVGFIQKLPHQLVTAFRSTLEEASTAHIIFHVIDASSPNWFQMIDTANDLLKELKADTVTRLYIFNKIDALKNLDEFKEKTKSYTPAVYISAHKKETLVSLSIAISKLLKTYQHTYTLTIPYTKLSIQNLIHTYGNVLSEEFTEDGVTITVTISKVTGDKLLAQLYS
jgi:GTP-binding protein HflX